MRKGGIYIFSIRFDIPNKYDQVLAQILEGLPVEDYIWTVEYDDIFVAPLIENKGLFRRKKLTGKEFQQDISSASYYVCFAKILAFLSEQDIQPIDTFSSFFQSKCKLILFFTDAVFVEIYSMDLTILKQLKGNAEKYGFQHIEFIHVIGEKDLDLMGL